MIQRADAKTGGEAVDGLSDASTESHWASLREGIRTVLRHPQGYGLGNAGSTAARTDTEIKAGESTYTELGVETGLVGGLVFVAWSIALAWRVLPRSALVGSALVAVLALALQTDILGVPWIVYVLWTPRRLGRRHPCRKSESCAPKGARRLAAQAEPPYRGSGADLARSTSQSRSSSARSSSSR